MDRKLILCIGDSLGLPRVELKYKRTWFHLLNEQFMPSYELIPLFKYGMTTDDLFHKNGDVIGLNYYADYIIIQLGIVDCAPRYIKDSSIQARIISKFPKVISSFIWKKIKAKGRKKEYAKVSIEKFKSNMQNFYSRIIRNGTQKVFLLSIAKPTQAFIINNPKIEEAVNSFNNTLEELTYENKNLFLVKELESKPEYYIEDGYHLNGHGAMELFNRVKKVFLDEV